MNIYRKGGKSILEIKLDIGKLRRGERLKMRWKDNVEEDLRGNVWKQEEALKRHEQKGFNTGTPAKCMKRLRWWRTIFTDPAMVGKIFIRKFKEFKLAIETTMKIRQ